MKETMFDSDKVFAQFAVWVLIGCLAVVAVGGGLGPLIAAAVALFFLRIFFDRVRNRKLTSPVGL